MELKKYKEEAQYFTGKLSEINRNLLLAGIAIIWIFKSEINGTYKLPDELLLPLMLLSISLLLDFLQYLYGATVWSIFFRLHEKKKINKPNLYLNDDIKAPNILSNISYFLFFYPKVVISLIGYIYIIRYLLQILSN